MVAYEEVPPNTLIRGRGGKDFPARGRMWIEAATGRVLATEIVVEDSEFRGTVDVRYQSDSAISHFVPGEMREGYDDRRDGSRVDGTATYSKFRCFQVQVEESQPFKN